MPIRLTRLVLLWTLVLFATPAPGLAGQAEQPAPGGRVRLAIAGLVHGHVRGFLRALKGRTDVELVAIAEPDAALRSAVLKEYGLDASLGFAAVDEMLDRARPDAVATFTSTLDHPAVVEASARRHVAVMMEKPLAVSVADGERIRRAAELGGIPVIVNYETTWYPSLVAARQVIKSQRAGGAIRKMVAMDGHQGPKEIGVGPEFLDWLTDPVKNGGGALFDFGCYGANLMTWLMDNERPLAVTAVHQQLKPAVYPHVDDEATILVEYAGAQGIIQASWNWPFNRKDFEVYAERAYAVSTGAEGLRVRLPGGTDEARTPPPLATDEDDSVSYLVAVVRGRIKPSGRSSLENNLLVTEILAAARESAETGRRVTLAGPAGPPQAPPPFLDPATVRPTPRPEDVATIEATIGAVYDVISGPAGPRNWARFKSLLLPECRLIPAGQRPDGQDVYRVMDADAYIERAGAAFLKQGFFETGVATRVEQFGNMAHVFSTYESRREQGAAPFARGINSFQLVKLGDRWWVASILWDSERPGLAIPDTYLGG